MDVGKHEMTGDTINTSQQHSNQADSFIKCRLHPTTYITAKEANDLFMGDGELSCIWDVMQNQYLTRSVVYPGNRPSNSIHSFVQKEDDTHSQQTTDTRAEALSKENVRREGNGNNVKETNNENIEHSQSNDQNSGERAVHRIPIPTGISAGESDSINQTVYCGSTLSSNKSTEGSSPKTTVKRELGCLSMSSTILHSSRRPPR